ncbi:MAG: hypothetical protein ACSHX5_05140 [Phycisphaerales bacterium]
MTISGNQLLAALGSGIIPGENPNAPSGSANSLSFDDVLKKIQQGKPSDLGVELGKEINAMGFADDLKAQASRAADLGAVNGMSNALVDAGGTILRLDVSNRVVQAQIEPASELVIDQIDGYISLKSSHSDQADTDSDESVQATNLPFNPARVVRNTSLADVLAARDR